MCSYNVVYRFRILLFQILLQEYVDDLFKNIFQVDDSVSPAVKYLYDFLDSAAIKHGITDLDVVHTWKSNRFLSIFSTQFALTFVYTIFFMSLKVSNLLLSRLAKRYIIIKCSHIFICIIQNLNSYFFYITSFQITYG